MDSVLGQSDSRFFKYVWRFNALAIAVASILMVVLGLYAAATIFKAETRPRQVTNVVNVGEKDKISEEFTLGSVQTIEGTPYVQIPLYRGQSYASAGSLYSKTSERNTANYLFLNTATYESRWLFDGAGQLITDSEVLFSKLKRSPDEARTGVGIILTIVEKDSNGDNRLTDKDAVSLAVSDVDGGRYRKLVEGIERLHVVRQIADDKVLVLYQKDQETVFELYSLPSMTRLQRSSITKLKLN
jgi:hypothetical protein